VADQGNPMKRVYAAISQFLSFEALFVLYLFAGIYKTDDAFQQYYSFMDFTLLFFLASLAAGIFIFIKQRISLEKSAINLILLFLIFIIYVGLSLSWSRSDQYGMTKFLYLAILNLWNLIAAALIIAPDTQRIRRFMFMVLVFSLIYVTIALPLTMDLPGDQFIELTGADYQGIAFIFCVGLMVLICFLIDSSQPTFIRITCFLISCIYFWILLFVGDRGFLIGSLVAMFVLFFLNPLPTAIKRQIYLGKRYILLLLIIFVSVIYVLEITGNTPVTLSRLMKLSAPIAHDSAETRISLYKTGIEMWVQHPIWGSGIGSFPVVLGSGDWKAPLSYPHNIIIEILAELGLVGLVIYALFLFSAVRLIIKTNRFEDYPVVSFVILLFIISLFDAIVSGDISDHRFLIVSVGLMLMPRQLSRQVADINQASIERVASLESQLTLGSAECDEAQ
jgi:O-antigen ligase